MHCVNNYYTKGPLNPIIRRVHFQVEKKKNIGETFVVKVFLKKKNMMVLFLSPDRSPLHRKFSGGKKKKAR